MERWGPGLWAEGEPWVASARTGLVKHPAPLWRHRARWHLVAVSGLPASSRARSLSAWPCTSGRPGVAGPGEKADAASGPLRHGGAEHVP